MAAAMLTPFGAQRPKGEVVVASLAMRRPEGFIKRLLNVVAFHLADQHLEIAHLAEILVDRGETDIGDLV